MALVSLAQSLRWMFIDLNCFFASCEMQLQPRLRGKPIGVVPLESDGTCVIAASYEARAYGVKVGTLVADARRMCPGIQFIPARPRAYVEFHHRILEAVDKHLYVDHVMSIDEVACRLTGKQTEPENAVALAKRIKQQILKDAGDCLTSSVGIAPNRFLGKVGSDMMKPDGLVTILPESLPYALHGLKLRDLPGIGPRMERRLHSHGIFTMEQLTGLDSLRMRRIWGGMPGVRFHAELHGADMPHKESTTSSMGHQHVLEPELRTYSGGLNITRKLLMKAAERMRNNGYFARQLWLQVKLVRLPNGEPGGHIENRLTFQETQDTGFLMHCLDELWAASMEGHKPHRTGILLGGLVEAQSHQLSLFESPRNADLMASVDALNARFGRYTVNFGVTTKDARKTGMDKIAFHRVPTLAETGIDPTPLLPSLP